MNEWNLLTTAKGNFEINQIWKEQRKLEEKKKFSIIKIKFTLAVHYANKMPKIMDINHFVLCLPGPQQNQRRFIKNVMNFPNIFLKIPKSEKPIEYCNKFDDLKASNINAIGVPWGRSNMPPPYEKNLTTKSKILIVRNNLKTINGKFTKHSEQNVAWNTECCFTYSFTYALHTALHTHYMHPRREKLKFRVTNNFASSISTIKKLCSRRNFWEKGSCVGQDQISFQLEKDNKFVFELQ